MKFSVIFEGLVTKANGDVYPAKLTEPLLDRILDILMESYGVEDATYSGALADGRVDISVLVTAYDLLEAQVIGSGAIRSAIHGAGAASPEWSIAWCSVKTTSTDEPVVSGDLVTTGAD